MFDHGPDKSMKLRFFEEGIEKFIKDKKSLNPQVLDWLVEQAWASWILNISKEEMKLLSVFEKVCRDFFDTDPDTAEKVFKSMYGAIPEAEDRSASVHEEIDYTKAHKFYDKEFLSKRIRSSLSEYNCLYENDFKIWATPVYASAIYLFRRPHKVSDPENVVHVPTSTKIQTIRDIKDHVPYGDLSVFVKGFDNEIRNAGVGHESFEIHDDGSFSLRVTDPYTGAIKGSGVIRLTEKSLRELTKQMRKTLWFFRVGLNVFFANNRFLVEKIAVLREMKIRDIRKDLDSFCDDRWLIVENFDFDDKTNKLSVCFKYVPKILGEKSQVYIGTAEAWDLVKHKIIVSYRDQIIGCVFHLLHLFNSRKSGVPELRVVVKDEHSKEIMDLKYERTELIRFLSEYKIPPKPLKGEYSKGEYNMEYHLRVPYGEHDKWKPIIDELLKNKE